MTALRSTPAWSSATILPVSHPGKCKCLLAVTPRPHLRLERKYMYGLYEARQAARGSPGVLVTQGGCEPGLRHRLGRW